MSALFAFSSDALRGLADAALGRARERGASDAAAEVSESVGLSVSTRKMKVETIEHTRDKGLSVTVYLGRRRGHASTSDFATQAIHEAVDAAYNIARFTAEDTAAGLPDDDTFERAPRDLDLFHPWDVDTDAAIRLAQACERAAFAVESADHQLRRRQRLHSVGPLRAGEHAAVSSAAIRIRATRSRSRRSRAMRNGMQRDDWYTALAGAVRTGDARARRRLRRRRALARLSSRQMKTRKVPVLFEAPLACGLVGNFVQATSGGALYRKASFLVDGLGKPVFADHITRARRPARAARHGLRAVRRRRRARHASATWSTGGVLAGYFLSSYSARKLGMESTGNAGGSHNLESRSSRAPGADDDFEAMVRKLGTGLLVTELIGQGVNYVTGDYSRGAGGFWVEGGKIAYPVEEITIAGNLRDMYRNIVAVGADRAFRGQQDQRVAC